MSRPNWGTTVKYVAWFTLTGGGYELHQSDCTNAEELAKLMDSWMESASKSFLCKGVGGNPVIIHKRHVIKIVIKESDR